jgi:uncharacterized protein DUF3108
MRRGYNHWRWLTALLLALLPAAALAERVPERLNYSLSWGVVPVGTASQEISDEGDGRRIVSTARSNAWLSAFYPVDDRTESRLSRQGPFPGESRSFRMLFKEGPRTRDREIVFDQAARKATYRDRLGTEQVVVPLVENTFDIYASFYHVRFLPLEVGKSTEIHVLDGKELQRLQVRVLKREKVRVPAGRFNTILVEPMIKAEGVFEGKGGLLIWLTDDERRIPVKVQTKVRVGSVTAVLTGGNY